MPEQRGIFKRHGSPSDHRRMASILQSGASPQQIVASKVRINLPREIQDLSLTFKVVQKW